MSGFHQISPINLRHQVGEFRVTDDVSLFAWASLIYARSDAPNSKRVDLRINTGAGSVDRKGGKPGHDRSDSETATLPVLVDLSENEIVTIRPAESMYDLGNGRFVLVRVKPTRIKLLDGYNAHNEPVARAELAIEQIAMSPPKPGPGTQLTG